MRTIKSMEEKYMLPALELVEKVFTQHSDAEEGQLVRSLVAEIRGMRFYVPELELIMVDEADQVIGYCMFSRFQLEGRYEDRLLILTPVAVKTRLQRQHISKELIEYGFETSAHYGITAHESVGLPAPECLMVKALVPGGLEGIHGQVNYSGYQALQ